MNVLLKEELNSDNNRVSLSGSLACHGPAVKPWELLNLATQQEMKTPSLEGCSNEAKLCNLQ